MKLLLFLFGKATSSNRGFASGPYTLRDIATWGVLSNRSGKHRYFICELIDIHFFCEHLLRLLYFYLNFSLTIFNLFDIGVYKPQVFLLLLKFLHLNLRKLLNWNKLTLQIVKFLLKNPNLLAICEFVSSKYFHLDQKVFIIDCRSWTFFNVFFYFFFCFIKLSCLLTKVCHTRLYTWNLPCQIEYRRLTCHNLHLQILKHHRILLQFCQCPFYLIVQLGLFFW